MFRYKIYIVFVLGISVCLALPVIEKKNTHSGNEIKDSNNNKLNEDHPEENWENNLEYERYLKEVVQALESDPEFRKKLESVDVEHIKNGKIADDLQLVDHNIRSRLDELKRNELQRLNAAYMKKFESEHGIDRKQFKMPSHLDLTNHQNFEVEDLKKLIKQYQKDMEVYNKRSQDEFKHYEMEKKFKYDHDLKGMNEEQRQKAMKEHEELIKKKREHEKPHHPISKPQLQEVWEDIDHMKGEEFDPQTFFHTHDLNGDGVWDNIELSTLFKKELDKMYDPNKPETFDINERHEEMERMQRHVFGEIDTNKDNFVSLEEFMKQSEDSNFDQDPGWEGIQEMDENELYSQQEYEEYMRQREAEIQAMIQSGAMSPPPGYYGNNVPRTGGVPPPAQGYQNVPQGHQAVPQGYQAVPQGHQAVPQGYQAVPQGYPAVPQGYQAVPQGYQAVPQPQGYQAVPQPQGYQAVPQPQGYQAVPQPQGYQAVPQPQGYQAVPQPQGYQAVPQDQVYIQLPSQGRAQAPPVPQGQVHPQAVPQAQALPKGEPVPMAGQQHTQPGPNSNPQVPADAPTHLRPNEPRMKRGSPGVRQPLQQPSPGSETGR